MMDIVEKEIKMKRLGMIMLCLLVVLPAALAQESPAYCAQLSAEDCALLNGGIENTNGAGSFNHSAFSLTLGGSGGTSTGNETTLTGSGPMLVGADGSIEAMHLSVDGDAFQAGAGEIVLEEGILYSDLPGEWQGLEAGSNDLMMGLISGNAPMSRTEPWVPPRAGSSGTPPVLLGTGRPRPRTSSPVHIGVAVGSAGCARKRPRLAGAERHTAPDARNPDRPRSRPGRRS